MITKEQYQNLKILCKSQNPDDIMLVGPIIGKLRKNKQISRSMVNSLYLLVIKESIWKWHYLKHYEGFVKVTRGLKEFKVLWLNGEL